MLPVEENMEQEYARLKLKQTEELLQQNDSGPGHAEREMTWSFALPRKPLNSA